MDIQPQGNNTINDDQELAKALAGISQSDDGLSFEASELKQPETSTPSDSNDKPINQPEEKPADDVKSEPDNQPGADKTSAPITNPVVTPEPIMPPIVSGGSDDLTDIKKDALVELKPLVDKLDLNAEEKFNIYLLLIRSTDDKSLIAPAHLAAREIADEAKRAQALLDVIKEIDYLSAPTEK